MYRKRNIRRISGAVLLEQGTENGNRNGLLENIVIRLYRIGEETFCGEENKEDGMIYKEKLFAETWTNKYGNYHFFVPRGSYSVGIDSTTLPDGFEAAAVDLMADYERNNGLDFQLRTKPNAAQPLNTEPALDLCAFDKVRHAYRKGLIDEGKKALYTLYSIFDREKLSEEYRSQIPIKSGTIALEEIQSYIGRPDADRDTVETARKVMVSAVPKLDREYRSPGGFFNIHYTLSGDNAVFLGTRYRDGVPAYVRVVAEAFDRVKTFTCGTRGFRQPVLSGGKTAIDVHIYNLKGLFGYTSALGKLISRETGIKTAPCYICIDNNFSRSKGFEKDPHDCIRVTAAHEFFHAVQYAYNVDADIWWKEASATWNEDEVYNGVNDYVRYIDNYFKAPHKPLEDSSYGGVVFVKYLSENLGGYETIRKIWENHASIIGSSKASIDRTIKAIKEGEDLGTVFNRFSACNYNPSQYYKEGAQWKTQVFLQETYQNYPVALTSDRLDHLSSRYQLFKPMEKADPAGLKLVIQANGKVRWGFKIQKRKRKDNMCSMTEIGMDREYDRLEIVLKDTYKTYSEVCLIPANLENERDQLQYSYSASLL